MNEILVTGIMGIISTLAGSIISWILARRKYSAEVDNTIIEGMKSSLSFYKELSEDNKRRLEEVLKRNEVLEDEVEDLKKRVNNLMENICMDLTCTLRQRDINLFNNLKVTGDKEE